MTKRHDLESIAILDLHEVYADLATDCDLDAINATIDECVAIMDAATFRSFEWNGFRLLTSALVQLRNAINHRLDGNIAAALACEERAERIYQTEL